MAFAGLKNLIKITAKSSQIPSDQTEFVYHFNMANFLSSVWLDIDNGGGSLRIVDDTLVNRLPLEVVRCEKSSEKGGLWWKDSADSVSNKDFYLYFNNASATQPARDAVYGSEAAQYDCDELVTHYNEDPSGTQTDSSDSNNGGTTFNMDSGNAVDTADLLDKGIDFNGTDEYLTHALSPVFDNIPANDFTVTIVLKSTVFTGGAPFQRIFEARKGAINFAHIFIGTNNGDIVFQVRDSAVYNSVQTDSALANNTPYNITVTWVASTNTVTLYLNGVAQSTAFLASVAAGTASSEIHIGVKSGLTASTFFDGIIDEVRVCNEAKSADLILAEANNQMDNNNFFDIGVKLSNIVALTSPLDTAIDIGIASTLIWATITGADTYNLQVSEVANFATTVINETLLATNSYAASLLNGTTYYWRVAHVDATGTSEWSEVWSFTTESLAPSSPQNPAAVAGDAQNTITWESVVEATSYNIYWKNSAGVTKSDNKIEGVSSGYIHTGLTNGLAYYYAIEASNIGGDSDLSIEVSATPTSSVTPPEEEDCTATPFIVTRQQAMDHLKIDDATAEADDLDLKILAASAVVLDYIEKEASDFLVDGSESSSDSDSDSDSDSSASTLSACAYPYQLQEATLLLIGDMHRYRDSVIPSYSDATLPSTVRAILHPLKSWGLEDEVADIAISTSSIVTRQQAMDHLKIDDATAEADDLDLKILAASAVVLDYIEKEASDFLVDGSESSSDSDSDSGSDSEGTAKYSYSYQLQAATLLLIGDMHRYRDSVIPSYSDATLPSTVRAILHPLKSWGLEDV